MMSIQSTVLLACVMRLDWSEPPHYEETKNPPEVAGFFFMAIL